MANVAALIVSDAPEHTNRGWVVEGERISVPHNSQIESFEWDKNLKSYVAQFSWPAFDVSAYA